MTLSVFSRKETLLPNLIIAFYALSLFCYSQYQALTNIYWIGDDWPQHLLWLYKFHPNFFQPDDYYLVVSEIIQPWGIYLLNSVLGYFISPIIISKVFPLLTLWVLCWFSFFLFKKRFGWIIAISAMVMMSIVPFERMVGFFARAYAFPLLLAFSYYWIEDNKRGILIVVLLSTLFYPVIFLVECVIIALDSAIKISTKKLKKHLKWYLSLYILIGVCCGILLLKSHSIETNELLGGFLSKKELLEFSEFNQNGRVDFHENMDPFLPLQFQWKSHYSFPYAKLDYYLVVALLVILIYLVLSKKSKHSTLDIYIIMLFLAGTILFYLAQWKLPQLFLPKRYLYYTYIPLLYFLLVRSATLIQALFKRSKMINLLLGVLLIFGAFHNKPVKNNGLIDYSKHSGLYEEINSFKEPALIAGPIAITSQIPTFCRQSVLFSHEAAHAIYFKNYYTYVQSRIEDFIHSYGSTQVATLVSFIKKYDIDYLILDKNFVSSKYLWFYEPYHKMMEEKMDNINVSDLALLKVPEQFIIRADERYDLIDCKKWILELESPAIKVSPK